MELKGVTTDWEGLEKAKQERWVATGIKGVRCLKHNTFFNPVGTKEFDYQDAEPCWQCHDEFQKEL